MAPTKVEQVERLVRALIARESELKANEEVIKRATFRSESLRTAIADLRTTIANFIGDKSDATVSAPLPPPAPEVESHPGLARTEGTILARVANHLDLAQRVFDATEIAQALGIGVDVVRTTLSKMYARGLIARVGSGEYCSLQHAHDIGAGVRTEVTRNAR
jgi:hypothetical protein